jgi:Methyltransferase domain
MLRQRLTRVLPRWIKSPVRDAVQRHRLGVAIARLLQLPMGQLPGAGLLEALSRAWGNKAFSPHLPFLAEVATQAARAEAPILECGSGLTTIVLGLLAGRRGIPVHTLEQMPDWFARISTVLRRNRIPGVQLHLTPLIEYGSFEWYELPEVEWPSEFRLVVCDGPPNLGGRYGLLPLVGSHLPAGAIILLDDATHPDEILVRQRWRAERRLREEVHEGPGWAYAVVTVDGVESERPGRRA